MKKIHEIIALTIGALSILGFVCLFVSPSDDGLANLFMMLLFGTQITACAIDLKHLDEED